MTFLYSARTMPDPWLLTPAQLDSVERDVRRLLGPGVESVMQPRLLPEHVAVVEQVARLAWGAEPIDQTVRRAFSVLIDATTPNGLIDPADDNGDVPWCSVLLRTLNTPALGSKNAREWFVLLERHRWNDVEVSSTSQAIAAYAVATMEQARGRKHEAHYWLHVAATQTEDDDRAGIGLAVVLRAARLLNGAA